MRATDVRPWFMSVMIPTFHAMEKKQFESQGAYSGEAAKWAKPYSKRYEKWKLRTVGHLQKEVLTGQLRASLFDSGHGSAFLIMDAHTLAIGTAVESDAEEPYQYATVQQFGAKTRLGQRGIGKHGRPPRTRRLSERIIPYKRMIPARPPVVDGSRWPSRMSSGIGSSLVTWIVTGAEIRPGL